jgi:predicted ATPase/DNA-binding winged helix-turn-helix (wHTH) protein
MRQFASFALDTSNECLWRDGIRITIPPKPFAVLRYLVENPGRLVTHDELLDALWPETYVQPQVLRTYMLDLRKVLGDNAEQPGFIQTQPKRGYRFIAPVFDGEWSTGEGTTRNAPQALKVRGIVDREEELSRLEERARLVATGGRQVVFVSGAVGIGKTAFVNEFCREVAVSIPAEIACGHGAEGLGTKEDYYPVIEALNQLCASPAGARASRILARIAPAWLPARAREASPSAATPLSIQRTRGDLCAALEGIAQELPLVLVLDDLHLADVCTLELISELSRRRTPAKLMLLATETLQAGATEHPLFALKQDLLVHRLCAQITLAPLARTAISELLRRELGQETPPDLDRFVYQHSEGNPLFALALLSHLIAQQFLVRNSTDDAGRWEQRSPSPGNEAMVPNELAQLIVLQIERLGPKQQRILEAASLMSVAFPVWAVAAALGQNTAETEEACEHLQRSSGLVHRAGHDDLPDGTRSDFYAFAHGLYREVLYQRQPAARRAQGHTRIAERLSEMFAGREENVAREIAMHYEAAGNWQRAARALRSAARDAQQRGACYGAAQLLEQALSVSENLSEKDRGSMKKEISVELKMIREAMNQNKPRAARADRSLTISG